MINFTKMQGIGNDYIYMNCIENQKIKNPSRLAKKISDRHFGVGSDGLILVLTSKTADFKMRIFNSDGTEAEMCGNGIRAFGKYVYDNKLTEKKNLKIETLAGIKNVKLNIYKDKVKTVKVDMGEPIFIPADIPAILDEITNNKLKLKVIDRTFNFTCVSVGNPHAITIVEDVDSIDIEKYGSVIENDLHFPNRVNVEFVQIIDDNNIKMRVWERGAKETLACGTGACASVVACVINDLTTRKINVKLLGGILKVEYSKKDNHIYMTGPAKKVFDGVI